MERRDYTLTSIQHADVSDDGVRHVRASTTAAPAPTSALAPATTDQPPSALTLTLVLHWLAHCVHCDIPVAVADWQDELSEHDASTAASWPAGQMQS
jgi:hypothetical protein